MPDHMRKVRKTLTKKKDVRVKKLKLLRSKIFDEEGLKSPDSTYTTLHGQTRSLTDVRKKSKAKCDAKTSQLIGKDETKKLELKVTTVANTDLEVKVMPSGTSYDNSVTSLKALGVGDETLKGIADLGVSHMTEIQTKAIRPLLEGRDLLATAGAGSGKAFAYLIPAITILQKLNFKPSHGTGIIVILPTRELAMQILAILEGLLKHHSLTYALAMGGGNRATEVEKLFNGANILITTPGRLVDHLVNTEVFVYSNLQYLVIDDANHILKLGFHKDMRRILKFIPKRRQTMIFSDIQNSETEDLARNFLKKLPLHVTDSDSLKDFTFDGFEVGYTICSSEKRFLALLTFLRFNRDKKVVIFLSSSMSAKFHSELLSYLDLSCLCINSKQKPAKKMSIFSQFCDLDKGILACTDVATRGLDMPAVDWLIQFDPPEDPKEFIYRICRSLQSKKRGQALLVLRPEEQRYVELLGADGLLCNEFDLPWSKLGTRNMQNQLEHIMKTNYFLHVASQEGYKAFIRSYASHALKSVFNVESLDVTKVALSFGFKVPPFVDFDVHDKKTRKFVSKTTKDLNNERKAYKNVGKKKKS